MIPGSLFDRLLAITGSDCNVAGGVNAGQCDNTISVISAANINDGQVSDTRDPHHTVFSGVFLRETGWQWHVVRAARPGMQTATLTIDGVTVESQGHGPNNAIDIGTAALYIGGHPNPSSFALGLSATQDLVGCISDVYYEMDYDMPQQHCGEGAKGYNGQSYDSYPNSIWNPDANMFTISFSFKTTSADGIIFVAGQDDIGGNYVSDHIVFELLQGQLHFDFAPGAGVCNINMHSTARLDDGAWHTVTASRLTFTTGSLRVDAVDTFGQTMGQCGAHGVNLNLPVYIGGHPTLRNAVCDPTLAAAQGCQAGGVQAGQITAGTARQTGVDASTNFAGCLSGIRVEEEFKVVNGRGTPTPAGSAAPVEGQCAGAHDGATAAAEFAGQTFLTFGKGANPGHLMFTFAFSFKTSGDGALVTCHGTPDNADHSSNGGDYMLLEVVNGKVHFGFSAGVSAEGVDSVVEITHTLTVDNNAWHHVTGARTTVLGASLTVDDVTMTQVADSAAHFGGIDLTQPMYIGGHPQYGMAGMQSATPFVGCMTDISFSMNFGAPRHVKSLDGHFEVIPHPMPWQQAQQYCAQNDYDLASLHSSQEQQLAADQCARFTQATSAPSSSNCVHTLANGDVNIATTDWISSSEQWIFVGCKQAIPHHNLISRNFLRVLVVRTGFVSDVDGGSHGDPWPDTGSNWKDLNWEGSDLYSK